MELGNMFFGNSRGEYEIDRSFQSRFCEVLHRLGVDDHGVANREEDMNDMGGITTDSYIIRPYYWGDELEQAKLPNFEFPSLDLKIKWYKYPLRDSYSNRPFTEEIMEELEKFSEKESKVSLY